MTHIDDDDLVMHAYDEGDDRASIEAHLTLCPECRDRFAGLRRDMALMTALDVPERGDDYGTQVWERIRPALVQVQPPARRLAWLAGGFSWPRLAFAGGVAALVIAAFVTGRYTRPADVPPPVVAEASAAVVKERILLVAVGDHLERSRVVLAEVLNQPADGAGLAPERAVAEDLVATNRLYRQTALESGHPAMASALEELERMLVEIANSPETVSAGELGRLRERIESQGLLFKVTVLGSQVRQRQQDAAARSALPKSST